MYDLTEKRQEFTRLNIMILMGFSEGITLRDFIDKDKESLTRLVIFDLFK